MKASRLQEVITRVWEKGMTPEEHIAALQENIAEYNAELSEQWHRIRALEQLAEMVIDPRKMPHQHEDLQTRMYCLQERARELMEVKDE